MRIELDEWASQGREVHRATSLLADGGVLAIPTDSGYAFACDLHCGKAIDRLYDLKQSPRSHPLSVILAAADDVGRYSGYVSTLAYRTLKLLLPGPYTFIVDAGTEIPKRMHKKRRTIGIRVPAAEILVQTERIRALIADPDRADDLRTAIEEGHNAYGTQTFDQSLLQLTIDGVITREDALEHATRPADMKLKMSGIT